MRPQVALAPRTTLNVGGPAAFFLDGEDVPTIQDGLRWARAKNHPVFILGGGSNVVVADGGFPGLVIHPTDATVTVARAGDRVRVRCGAGVSWDALVEKAVAEGWAGIECLSGIPGRVGAAPIQNIGAYGQEIGPSVHRVELVDLSSGETLAVSGADCDFGYRHSRFKTTWRDRYVVTAVTLELIPNGPATVRYPALREALDLPAHAPPPPLTSVRQAVLTTRAAKSMVWNEEDPNSRSAGSFFLNPVVTNARADEIATGVGNDGSTMPRYPTETGQTKLAAAWLIERAGFRRGFLRGEVGLSDHHALAVINRGGGTAAEVAALARDIIQEVRARFGVTLTCEPQFIGFDADPVTG